MPYKKSVIYYRRVTQLISVINEEFDETDNYELITASLRINKKGEN